MAINRYDTPAEAKFINTYVPIPFDMLGQIEQQAREDRMRNESAITDFNTKYGEFNSRSKVDMEHWNNIVNKPMQKIAQQIASNPDSIKGEEGRRLVNSFINNVDYGKLSLLKRGAQNYEEAAKKYDTRWNDGTLEEMSTWDSLGNGLYDKPMLPYQSIDELATPYFKDLKPSFDEKLSNNKWEYMSINKDALDRSSDTMYSALYNDPTFKKHLQKLGVDKLPEEERREFVKNYISQSQSDRLVTTRQLRPDYLDALRYSRDLALAKARGGADKKGSGEEENLNTPNRVEYNKMDIANMVEKTQKEDGYGRLTDSYLRTGKLDFLSPSVSKIVNTNSEIQKQLYAKVRRGEKLTPEETKTYGELENARYSTVATLTLAEKNNSQIKALEQYGAPIGFLDLLKRQSNYVLEGYVKANPDINIGASEEYLNNTQKELNYMNQGYDKLLKQVIDETVRKKGLNNTNRMNLIDKVYGFGRANVPAVEVDDYLEHDLGGEVIYSNTSPYFELNSSDIEIAKKYPQATKERIGVAVQRVDQFRFLDYSNRGDGLYVNPNDNSVKSKIATFIRTNPQLLEQPIKGTGEESDKKSLNQLTFNRTSAPVIAKSDMGKVHIEDGGNKPIYVAKTDLGIPAESMENVFKSLKIINEDTDNSKSKKVRKKANDKRIKDIIKQEFGYEPEIKKINGVDYVIMKTSTELFNSNTSNIKYNYQLNKKWDVKTKNANDDASYISTEY